MKCEVCLELLDEYLDGELEERAANDIASHLIRCVSCTGTCAELKAEQEMFILYDRQLEVPASLWNQIAERTVATVDTPRHTGKLPGRFFDLFRVPAFGLSLASAVALIVMGILIGGAYLHPVGTDKSETASKVVPVQKVTGEQRPVVAIKESPPEVPHYLANRHPPRIRHKTENRQSSFDRSDVLSTDFGYEDIDDRDTAKHLEQTQNLLRSIRNVRINDGDQEIDVSYDKALSRRLLNQNIVLRREAEMKAKFPTKSLLSDLEPFLIDIANLPDQAKPEEVRAIKERVRKTEIVAALIGYE